MPAPEPEGAAAFECRFCGSRHPSRTQLFKHLRSSALCAQATVSEGGASSRAALAARAPRRCAALLVGYTRDAAAAEEAVARFIEEWSGAAPWRLSRASSASHRGLPALAQPQDVGACGDVLVVAYNAQDKDPAALLRALDEAGGSTLRALGASRLPASAHLHAEAACTQRECHYMLPMRWLSGGGAAEAEMLSRGELMANTPGVQRWRTAADGADGAARRVLRELKTVLRGVAAPATAGPKATGKRLRSFHNFADPRLPAAERAPGSAAVSRTLDRCRVVEQVALPVLAPPRVRCTLSDPPPQGCLSAHSCK